MLTQQKNRQIDYSSIASDEMAAPMLETYSFEFVLTLTWFEICFTSQVIQLPY